LPYVITQSCCADAACVVACPVNAIHPAPGEPGFGSAEMLFVDPVTCVDCGACATACPVNALLPHTKLAPSQARFEAINADYYANDPHPNRTPLALVPKPRQNAVPNVRVAIVGAGPAGMYAADELLKVPGISVDVFDRLPTPHGLARFGVAPDHGETKRVIELFHEIEQEKGFNYRLNVEVGKDVLHEQLAEAYHAVLYSVGAATDRRLGLEGEELPGSVSATEFVAWYNGHPDAHSEDYPFDSERAVVIGNGNVALDVARILATNPDHLATTDISDQALAALRDSRIREIVILGRRGPADAAFTLPELIGLAAVEDYDVVVDGDVEVTGQKTDVLAELAARPLHPERRRIVLRFNTVPVRIVGDGRVEGIEVDRTEVLDGVAVAVGEPEVIEAGLVLRAVGYRAHAVPGLPFDDERAVVPNERGRVEPGTYVAGWIKRGPNGFLGTNKTCSQETVESLLDDLEAGRLAGPSASIGALPHETGQREWLAIDAAEREAGTAAGRPRVKFTDRESLLAAATGPDGHRHGRKSRR
jgi:ferredoxin--NADP+ reductase